MGHQALSNNHTLDKLCVLKGSLKKFMDSVLTVNLCCAFCEDVSIHILPLTRNDNPFDNRRGLIHLVKQSIS